jgi:hypothetical protein
MCDYDFGIFIFFKKSNWPSTIILQLMMEMPLSFDFNFLFHFLPINFQI